MARIVGQTPDDTIAASGHGDEAWAPGPLASHRYPPAIRVGGGEPEIVISVSISFLKLFLLHILEINQTVHLFSLDLFLLNKFSLFSIHLRL
jgi:hypothetical protein